MDLPIISLLSRIQSLSTIYGTNNVTNNTAELLARILASELVLLGTPTFIIYDSAVVHVQYLALLSTMYTNRQCTRTVFPTISHLLSQYLEATRLILRLNRIQTATLSPSAETITPTLRDNIVV